MASMLSSIMAGSNAIQVAPSVLASLQLLLKGGPMASLAAAQQPSRRGVSHLSSSGADSSRDPLSTTANSKVAGKSPFVSNRPIIPRGTAATHLRSFAAQPALADAGEMFCVSLLWVHLPTMLYLFLVCFLSGGTLLVHTVWTVTTHQLPIHTVDSSALWLMLSAAV